jgi:acetyl-CoA carboxylase/biotin carboxylase 1
LDERIEHRKEVRLQGQPDPLIVVLVGAVCSTLVASRARRDGYVVQLERGQLPVPAVLSQADDLELIYGGLQNKLRACRSGPIQFTLFCNGKYVQVQSHTLLHDNFLVLDGQKSVFTKDNDPTLLVTNTTGKLPRYLANDGANLRRDMPVAEIKVVKMYMPLLTPEDGVVRLLNKESDVLAPSLCIAKWNWTMHRASRSRRSPWASCQLGTRPQLRPSLQGLSVTALPTLRRALVVLQPVLESYFAPCDQVDRAVSDLFRVLRSPLLPVNELHVGMSPLAGRIPLKLFATVMDKLESFRSQPEGEFDVNTVVQVLDAYKATERVASDFETNVATLRAIVAKKVAADLHSGMQSMVDILLT